MPKATDEPTAPPLRLGQHPRHPQRPALDPRHPQRPALVNEAGQAQCTFPSDATRAEIAERLRAGGFVLHDDNTVTKAEQSDAPDTPAPEVAAAVVALTAPSVVRMVGVDEGHLSRHMGSLLRDLGAPDLPADSQGASDGPAPWVNPDAGLIALCDEAGQLDAEEANLGWVEDWDHPENAHRRSEAPAAKAAFAAAQQRYGEVLQEIASTPARTPFGSCAKARVLLTFWGDTLPEEDTTAGEVLASLLRDLAGEAA